MIRRTLLSSVLLFLVGCSATPVPAGVTPGAATPPAPTASAPATTTVPAPPMTASGKPTDETTPTDETLATEAPVTTDNPDDTPSSGWLSDDSEEVTEEQDPPPGVEPADLVDLGEVSLPDIDAPPPSTIPSPIPFEACSLVTPEEFAEHWGDDNAVAQALLEGDEACGWERQDGKVRMAMMPITVEHDHKWLSPEQLSSAATIPGLGDSAHWAEGIPNAQSSTLVVDVGEVELVVEMSAMDQPSSELRDDAAAFAAIALGRLP